MPCYQPIEGWRTPGGKVTFEARGAILTHKQKVPCGQCVGCRLEQARQWSVRIQHEASLHSENSFVTLTYAPENMPPGHSLRKSDFQKFMKRLRKRNDGRRIRYFAVGEYGDRSGHPHYHAILFGHSFSDRTYWSKREGHDVFRSADLEKTWTNGLSEIGSVTKDSAGYVARYCMKKVAGEKMNLLRCDPDDGEIFEVEREFSVMSRRPGIGAEWLERFGQETYRDDSVVIGGKEQKPPSYYDVKYAEVDPDRVESVKAARKLGRDRSEERPQRLETREKCARARITLGERRSI